MTGLFNITGEEFRMISTLVYEKTGITLGDHKQSLLIGRLSKELRENGFQNFSDYYNHVVNDTTGKAVNTLIEKISTNHTFFWREFDHFEMFRDDVLPQIVDALNRARKKDIRIWCAGCSSGEEPYTLSMIAQDYCRDSGASWDVGILATDISKRVLEKAVAGVYSDENVRNLPNAYIRKYFDSINSESWTVSPAARKPVMYRTLNLMREEYPFRGKFHAIFCRNVMIYFDTETRLRLVERFHRYMEPGGYLFIGHSESLGRTNSLFRYIRPAVYRKDE